MRNSQTAEKISTPPERDNTSLSVSAGKNLREGLYKLKSLNLTSKASLKKFSTADRKYLLANRRYILESILVAMDPVIDPKVQSFCKLPYPRQKNGCPNFGKREDCPPTRDLLEKKNDKFFLVGINFNLNQFVKDRNEIRKEEGRPPLPEGKMPNILWWQKKAQRLMNIAAKAALTEGQEILINPEAQGVNLDAMMKLIGKPLQWPPTNSSWRITLIKEKE